MVSPQLDRLRGLNASGDLGKMLENRFSGTVVRYLEIRDSRFDVIFQSGVSPQPIEIWVALEEHYGLFGIKQMGTHSRDVIWATIGSCENGGLIVQITANHPIGAGYGIHVETQFF